MKFKYLFAVFSVVFLSDVVFADGENDKGLFPYMGFIYYSDESVVDSTGKRFLRGAILIQKDWLITSAVQISDNVNDVGFPRKTLLARFGAVAIDGKFTLNEDEDEQEREIIQIVRPYNHSATQWWRTDITLMQTLLPFNLTVAVNVIPPLQPTSEKQCYTLIYVRRHGNASEDKVLIQAAVELLPPSIQNCGSPFFEETMTCASDSEEMRNELFDPNSFCQGNSGGPLVCNGIVIALQTYIDNNCKAPHLYQLLSPWKLFVTCAITNKCDERDCAEQCIITNKDSPMTLQSSSQTSSELESSPAETSATQDTTTTTMSVETSEETSEVTVMTPSSLPIALETETTTKVVTEESHETTTEALTTSTMKEQQSESSEQPRQQAPEQSQEQAAAPMETLQSKTWPKESEESKNQAHEDECEDAKRRTNVEAQQDARQNTWQEERSHAKKKKVRSAAERNMCLFQTVFYAVILAGFL